MLDLDEQVSAGSRSERIPERADRRERCPWAAGHNQRPRFGSRSQQTDQPSASFADLAGGERGVTALSCHVGSGDEPAQVAVPRGVLRQEHDQAVPGKGSDRERGAEDGPDADLAAGVGEPGRPVQAVSVGEGHRRHPQLGCPEGQVLRGERPVLHGEEGAHGEVDEGRGGVHRPVSAVSSRPQSHSRSRCHRPPRRSS